jgi:hypothetical protein
VATSNLDLAEAYRDHYPHTFGSLQYLVPAMAKVFNNRGKFTVFRKDKGVAAYKKFEAKLADTILAMVLDRIIARNAQPSEIRENLIRALEEFETVFPNWQDAYTFGKEYFVDSPTVAEDRIRNLMR